MKNLVKRLIQKKLLGDVPSCTLKPSAIERIKSAEAIVAKEETSITTSAKMKSPSSKPSFPGETWLTLKSIAYRCNALYESSAGNQQKANAYKTKIQAPGSSINGNTFFHHHMALQALLKPQRPGQR